MPDVNNRDELERKLAEQLGKLGGEQLRSLLKALGDPPDVKNVPPEWWDKYGAALREVLQPYLQDVYTQQAHTMATAVNITPNWTLINKGAAEWARAYTYELVKGVADTTSARLGEIIAQSFEENVTLGETMDSISGLFGADRAARIATTEITRAAAQSEIAVQEEAAADGIKMRRTWMTREDELVCDICGEGGLSGAQENEDGLFFCEFDGGYYDAPPAHPNCRCATGMEVVA